MEELAKDEFFIVSQSMLEVWTEKVLIDLESNGTECLDRVDIRELWEL